MERELIMLNVGYASHNGDWNWKKVQSPFARIHYVISGEGRIVREDGSVEVRPGSLYLTPAYMTHSYECDGRLELYYIHVYEDSGSHMSLFDLYNFPAQVKALPIDRELVERLIAVNPGRELPYFDPQTYNDFYTVSRNLVQSRHTLSASMLETQGIVQQLFSRFMASATPKNESMEKRILDALCYIHENIESPIGLDDLAQRCFLTKDHFIRLFKRETGTTPGRYINRVKIKAAQLRLLVDKRPVKEIAFGLGFDNICYFDRLFTRIIGESPVAYRRRMGLQ